MERLPSVDKQLVSVDVLFQDERSGFLGNGTVPKSPDIDLDIRRAVVDWLLLNSLTGYFSTETFLKTVLLFDASLARMHVLKLSDVQLLSLACTGLACAMNEIHPMNLKEYNALTDDTYTRQDIDDMQVKVFKLLGCSASVASELDYLDIMAIQCSMPSEARRLAERVLFAMAVCGSGYLPSVRATAAIYIARQVHWGFVQKDVFNAKIDAPMACAREFVEYISNTPLSSAIKKLRWGSALSAIQKLDIKSASVHASYFIDTYFQNRIALRLISSSVISTSDPYLGQGTFGVVRRVTYDGSEYAVKQSIQTQDSTLSQSEVREISIILSLAHENVISIYHITHDLSSIFLPLGYGDLRKWISNRRQMNEDQQLDFALQILGGLSYIHTCGVLHRDIKPQNIIVNLDNGAPIYKISDFGAARGCGIGTPTGPYTGIICTLWYRSPEILMGLDTYNDRLDVWSIMCVLYEFATSDVLFAGANTDFDQLLKIFSKKGAPSAATWPGFAQLPMYKLVSGYSFKDTPEYFTKDKRICPLYQSLIEFGLILDPVRRPSSVVLYDMVKEYMGL